MFLFTVKGTSGKCPSCMVVAGVILSRMLYSQAMIKTGVVISSGLIPDIIHGEITIKNIQKQLVSTLFEQNPKQVITRWEKK